MRMPANTLADICLEDTPYVLKRSLMQISSLPRSHYLNLLIVITENRVLGLVWLNLLAQYVPSRLSRPFKGLPFGPIDRRAVPDS